MKNRLGRIGVLMVALVLVVGVMGAGFASWTDQLVVNGIVTTASFDVGICDATAFSSVDLSPMVDLDWGPNYETPPGMLYPDPAGMVYGMPDPQYGNARNDEGKNVASTNSYNVTESYRFDKDVFMLGSTPFYGTVREVIKNAYPWYASGVVLLIGNAGSIPVHITDVDFNLVSGDPTVLAFLELNDFWWCVHTDTTCSGQVHVSGGIAALEELLSGWPSGVPFQLEPCETLWLQLNWHFEQEVDIDGDGDMEVMPQDADCVFDITITAEQWSE